MAAAIREEFSVKPKLIKGDNGVFDVEVDGRLIFSKHQADRFPENQEILELLRS